MKNFVHYSIMKLAHWNNLTIDKKLINYALLSLFSLPTSTESQIILKY